MDLADAIFEAFIRFEIFKLQYVLVLCGLLVVAGWLINLIIPAVEDLHFLGELLIIGPIVKAIDYLYSLGQPVHWEERIKVPKLRTRTRKQWLNMLRKADEKHHWNDGKKEE